MKQIELFNDGLEWDHYEEDIPVRKDRDNRTIWASRKSIALIFDITDEAVAHHISNLRKHGVLDDLVTKKFLVTNVKRDDYIDHHSLEVIVYIGFRAHFTTKVIKFQRWANNIIIDYIIDSGAINVERIINGVDIFGDPVKTTPLINHIISANPKEQQKEIEEIMKETWERYIEKQKSGPNEEMDKIG